MITVLRKRSQAFGVLAIGSSIGGTVFPIMAQQLLGKVGFKWTIRITAFVLALAVFIANFVRNFCPSSYSLLLTL